jgi:hypothetical protein
MKIPKEFKLQDHVINVVFDDIIVDSEGNELMGESDSDINIIKVAKRITRGGKKVKIPKSQVDHAFCHELVHQILDRMNEYKLSDNEKFIDQFSGFLLQFLNTKK